MIVGTADSVSLNRPPSSSFRAIIADDYQSFKGTIHRTDFSCERVESKAAAQSLDARAASKTPGPWSGKWSVQGAPYAAGVWVLKQEGATVVSTGESYHRISGKALENRLDGDVLRPFGPGGDLKLNAVLSADGKTFKGDLSGKQGAWQITAVRAD